MRHTISQAAALATAALGQGGERAGDRRETRPQRFYYGLGVVRAVSEEGGQGRLC